jgi:hypothetical protein
MEVDPEKSALWGELNGQTGKISWKEIERHFARGRVVWVAPDLDLVDVAVSMVRDDKSLIEQFMTTAKLVPLTDEQAGDWSGREAELWAVVAAPWVLVQERSAGPA